MLWCTYDFFSLFPDFEGVELLYQFDTLCQVSRVRLHYISLTYRSGLECVKPVKHIRNNKFFIRYLSVNWWQVLPSSDSSRFGQTERFWCNVYMHYGSVFFVVWKSWNASESIRCMPPRHKYPEGQWYRTGDWTHTNGILIPVARGQHPPRWSLCLSARR